MSYKETVLARMMGPNYARPITESTAADDREDGLADGFNIPLDAQARALAARVKMPMARRIVALLQMAGVPGRYLASEEAEGSILAATDMLRKKTSTRKAFLDFYETLAGSRGYAIGDEPPPEETEEVKESTAAKKGNYIQKLFSSVLIELGLPAHLATVSAPSAVQTGLLKTSREIEEDGALERTLRLLAMRLGLKADEVREPVGETELEEAVSIGNDEFFSEVLALVSNLGIPDDILERRKPQLTKALRDRKQTLRNRGTIMTNIKRLNGLLQANTVQANQADPEQ